MRLSVVLLWCLFILCMTRTAKPAFNAMSYRVSNWAALSLLLLCANAFTVRAAAELILNPAALLLCAATGAASVRACGGLRTMQAAACAAPASVAMLALSRMQAAGAAASPEPGLFLALAGLLFFIPLAKTPAAVAFGIALAPLLLGVWEAGLDLYAFGYAIVEIGVKKAFDAQTAGVALTILLLAPLARARRGAGAPPPKSRTSS